MEFFFSKFCLGELDKVPIGGIFYADFDAFLGEMYNSSIVGNSDKIKLGRVSEVVRKHLYGNVPSSKTTCLEV